jgi:SAM-dependent methyltransferase
MNRLKPKLAINSGKSVVVDRCQSCGFEKLHSIIFLGYLPPVNNLIKVGTIPQEQPSYPAQMLYCKKCHLVQLGLIVDPNILFPPEYPYTSSTTKVLRDNFKQLAEETNELIPLKEKDLVIDIGSNDGNLLNNFKDKTKVLGITPEEIGKIAIKNGIPTIIDYFTEKVADKVIKKYGKAKIITATNVFAHIEDVNEVIRNIKKILANDGVFISESHYLSSLIKTVQYDTIYHEHLRYYSLHSLKYLLAMHGLEVFYAREIPPHGGSIRVYAARKGKYKINKNVREMLNDEKKIVTSIKQFEDFKDKVVMSKLKLYNILNKIKEKGGTIYGIGAPARGSTLISYVGLDSDIMPCVLYFEFNLLKFTILWVFFLFFHEYIIPEIIYFISIQSYMVWEFFLYSFIGNISCVIINIPIDTLMLLF